VTQLIVEPSASQRGRAIERRAKRRSAGRLLPARLGAFELFDHIGRGGMADIYRARRKGGLGLERQVVIKEVLPEYANCEHMANLLAEEARIASRLEHPNIVRIEDLQREDGNLYIAMEYVEGLDLRETLRAASRTQTRIPIEVTIFIVEEILKALDYAHGYTFTNPSGLLRQGIIHRDVSPSNVLLSLDGEVKLCDFGIARSFDGVDLDDASSELGGLVEGKAGYMSPEQARGESLDGRADTFAAGILLWELISGRKLYKAAPGESLFDVARRAEVPPLRSRGLPHEEMLFAIVAKATSFDREQRYATAAQMGEALGAYAAHAGFGRRSFMLQGFLEENFAESLREVRKRRELATRALAIGPLASVEVIAAPGGAAPVEGAGDDVADVASAEPVLANVLASEAPTKRKRAKKAAIVVEPTVAKSTSKATILPWLLLALSALAMTVWLLSRP
jgi:serine/threonine-protein kinase